MYQSDGKQVDNFHRKSNRANTPAFITRLNEFGLICVVKESAERACRGFLKNLGPFLGEVNDGIIIQING